MTVQLLFMHPFLLKIVTQSLLSVYNQTHVSLAMTLHGVLIFIAKWLSPSAVILPSVRGVHQHIHTNNVMCSYSSD